jgi:hypothetical protein
MRLESGKLFLAAVMAGVGWPLVIIAGGQAVAGEKSSGKPVPVPAAGIPAALPALPADGGSPAGWEWSVGYDSQENFRGMRVADDLIWTGASGGVPLAENMELGVNAWYASEFDEDYQELNLGAGLIYDAHAFKLGVGYTYYYYPDGSQKPVYTADETHELGVSVSRTLGPFDVHAGYSYDFGAGGHYIEIGADYGWRLSHNVRLEVGASVSYGIDYYAQGDGWNHVSLRSAMPISLTKRVILTPYLALVAPLDQRDDLYDTEFFGGIRLTVGF